MRPTILRSHRVLLGESPPPGPRSCFGRDELIEEVVRLTRNIEPVALIGAGGIGKTSIALTVLHHDQVKERFGENRRFIRCDQFPTSCTHFLARLSKVIGAGVDNPEDLTPLRPFLSSKEMLIVLDNAESILDPLGMDAQEIYLVVDELCQFKTICLLITSRITTIPRHCKRPEIPTLSMEAASDIFYSIYGDVGRSNIISNLLQRVDFHPLSITLLATTASHNTWDSDRLAMEWDTQRAQVLHTDFNKNLAATIELSLTSPTFRGLGPDARELLGVTAFFTQGINEGNIDRLFPTFSNRKHMFNQFCVLSLTYRSNGFITMLAPIRDYLGPRDLQSSPLLCATRDSYFSRLSFDLDLDEPGFKEARWIMSEDVNVEHLLDVFTTINPHKDSTLDVCLHFMRHLYWHKPRQTVLGSKLRALPNNHPSKPKCLFELSRLFGRLRNHTEQMKLLVRTLELEKQWGDDALVAQTLLYLSDVNRLLGLHEKGIQQVKAALEILERIDYTKGQAQCLNQLAWVLFDDKQLGPAEETASRAMDLITEKGQQFIACQLHRVLGKICGSKGEKEKAIHHFETALGIASPPSWREELFWIHLSLAELFGSEDEFDDANAHIKQAKSHAVDDTYRLGRAMDMQANVWCVQLRFEDAKLEALEAIEIYEGCGAADDAGVCRGLLQMVERAMEILPMGFRGELLKAIPHDAPVNFP